MPPSAVEEDSETLMWEKPRLLPSPAMLPSCCSGARGCWGGCRCRWRAARAASEGGRRKKENAKAQAKERAEETGREEEARERAASEAKLKAAMDEELAAAQGFRISDMELTEAQGRVENASERLKRLQDERAAAIAKKKALDEANERLLTTEAEIARLEEELARLKSDTPLVGSTPTGGPVTSETLPLADAPRS